MWRIKREFFPRNTIGRDNKRVSLTALIDRTNGKASEHKMDIILHLNADKPVLCVPHLVRYS